MKKIILFLIWCIITPLCSWEYHLENAGKKVIQTYSLDASQLEKPLSRKELVRSLYEFYDDYQKTKWNKVSYEKIPEIDNTKYFKDVDLNSSFWKKLRYFVHKWAFEKKEYFSPNATIDRETFFKVFKKLHLIASKEDCKKLKICEVEMDDYSPFHKGIYYQYIGRLLYKDFRKYYTIPQQYIEAGYQPYLSPKFAFPNKKQSLNGCYAFTVRNILKYKHNIGINIDPLQTYIEKDPKKLWYNIDMENFNSNIQVTKKTYFSLDTLMNALKNGNPVWIRYTLKYTQNSEKKEVPHIASAYSFDEKWVWIADTYSNKNILLPYDDFLQPDGSFKRLGFLQFYYTPVSLWTPEQKQKEKQYNFLVWEK